LKTTGCVGFAVTLVAVVMLGGLAALAWLQQRSGRTVQASLGRNRDKDRAERAERAERAKAQELLATATSALQLRTAVLKDRFAAPASVVLDDVIRAAEQEVTSRWPRSFRTSP